MIEVAHLTRRFGSHVAVDDLSFTAKLGRIYGFLGPNGAGKSTTMNIMTGYLAATSGSVKIDGLDIMTEPERAREKIGYLPEVPPVYDDMTVREYLTFAAELRRIPKKERAAEVERCIAAAGLEPMQNRLIRNLSKGYRQRTGLAMALTGNPEVLILDEPTSGLDPEQQKEMFDYLRSLRNDHTIIISSHILSDISAVCDEVWIMDHGRLIASDTPDHLSRQMTTGQEVAVTVLGAPADLRAALEGVPGIGQVTVTGASRSEDENAITATVTSDTQEDIRPAISGAIAAAGLTLLSMTRAEKSLEDVFLTLTREDQQEAERRAQEASGAAREPETGKKKKKGLFGFGKKKAKEEPAADTAAQEPVTAEAAQEQAAERQQEKEEKD